MKKVSWSLDLGYKIEENLSLDQVIYKISLLDITLEKLLIGIDFGHKIVTLLDSEYKYSDVEIMETGWDGG